MTVIRAKKKSGGGKCCLFGCLTIFALVGLVIGLIIWGVTWFTNELKVYADDKPLDLPSVEMEQSERDTLITRWEDFSREAEAGQPTAIELTDRELNALFQFHPDVDPNFRNTYFRIQDGTAKMLGSYELFSGTEKPYLNFVLTLAPAQNADSFFQFNVERITFPAENITPEQKESAQIFVRDFFDSAGTSIGAESGRLEFTEDRMIINVGVTVDDAAVPPTPDAEPSPDAEPAPDAEPQTDENGFETIPGLE